jgi:hypothetical protein
MVVYIYIVLGDVDSDYNRLIQKFILSRNGNKKQKTETRERRSASLMPEGEYP